MAALVGYKNGSRAHDTMKGLADALDDSAMKNLAAYFAAQEPKAPSVRKPLSTAEWVERCNRCHGVNGNSTDPRFPMLASQRVEYLQKALLDYRAQTRKSNEMHAMAGGLSEGDIEISRPSTRMKKRARCCSCRCRSDVVQAVTDGTRP